MDMLFFNQNYTSLFYTYMYSILEIVYVNALCGLEVYLNS